MTKILSVHFSEQDLKRLDDLVGSHRRATRHLVHLLAIREGLPRLTPEDIATATHTMVTRVMRPKRLSTRH